MYKCASTLRVLRHIMCTSYEDGFPAEERMLVARRLNFCQGSLIAKRRLPVIIKTLPASRTALTPNEMMLLKEVLKLKKAAAKMKSKKLLMRKQMQLLRKSKTTLSCRNNVHRNIDIVLFR